MGNRLPDPPTEFLARDAATGLRSLYRIAEGRIASIDPLPDPAPGDPPGPLIAPAFWDIQVNGRWGISFSDPGLTVDQVAAIVRAQAGLGTARLCPTLITAAPDATRHGVATIVAACRAFPDIDAMVLGIHLEGPWISPLDGYRGAHPLSAVRGPDPRDFDALQEAAEGRIVLVTLAPERPGAIDMIRHLVAQGIVVALGHTAADGATLSAAVDAGARLSTHLGNGLADPLPRHPNPIWDQAVDDRLYASLIADGDHLGPAILRGLVRCKGADRLILVSDASPLAGLPPGIYGPWTVEPSGRIVVTGTPYLAGAGRDLAVGIGHLVEWGGLTIEQAIATATTAPATLLGRDWPTVEVGALANVVLIESEPSIGLRIRRAWVDGRLGDPSMIAAATQRP